MNAVLILAAAFLGGEGAAQGTAATAGPKTVASKPAPSAPRLFRFREDGRDGKWGYIDVTGKVVIKPKYLWAELFREGRGPVLMTEGSSYCQGCIDEQDRLVFRLRETSDPPMMGPFFEGMASFRSLRVGVSHGFCDRDGQVVVPAKYADVSEVFRGSGRGGHRG